MKSFQNSLTAPGAPPLLHLKSVETQQPQRYYKQTKRAEVSAHIYQSNLHSIHKLQLQGKAAPQSSTDLTQNQLDAVIAQYCISNKKYWTLLSARSTVSSSLEQYSIRKILHKARHLNVYKGICHFFDFTSLHLVTSMRL